MPPRLQIRGHRGKPSDILPREPVLDLDAEILYVGTEDGLPVAISNQISLESRIAAMESEALKSSDVSVEVEPAKIVRRTGEGKIKSDLIGTADTAKALVVARRIRLTGAATGQVMFNGSSDVDISVTVLDDLGNPLGNMNTDVYDPDRDGIVEHAALADAVDWTGITNKPINATTETDGLFAATDKTKLNGIAEGAEVNVNPDWNATDGDALILNKPSTFPPSTHDHDSSYEPKNTNIQSHISAIANPHGTTYEQVGAEPANTNIQSHIADTDNPHGVTASQVGAEPANANIQSHIADTDNPHSVTKVQVGLGNVDNTADTEKPISSAQQNALNLKANTDAVIPISYLDTDTALTENSDSKVATQKAVKSYIDAIGGGGGGGVAVGTVAYFPANAAPAEFIKLNGATLSRAAYSNLWDFAQASGNIVAEASWDKGKFSTGDLSTTFRIPDLRGQFVRTWDDSAGVDSGRGIGTYQADDNKAHTHVISGDSGGAKYYPLMSTGTGEGRSGSSGTESRPKNVALLACIKY